MAASRHALDARTYRRTIGLFATGVTVIATGDPEEGHVMTANAITSVSLDPMLLLFCVNKDARMAEALMEAEGFSINVLRHEQRHLSTYFAGGWDEETPPAFEFVAWRGGPRLRYCAAAIGCTLEDVVEGGDHWIAIGRVIALHRGRQPIDPLIFYAGHYRQLAAEPDYEIPAVWDFAW